MAATRIEQSTQRLQEIINSSKRYLEKEVYDINELQKLRNQLEKKRLQQNKDLKEYEKLPEKDNTKLSEYEKIQDDGEETSDDLECSIKILEIEEEKEYHRQQKVRKRKRTTI